MHLYISISKECIYTWARQLLARKMKVQFYIKCMFTMKAGFPSVVAPGQLHLNLLAWYTGCERASGPVQSWVPLRCSFLHVGGGKEQDRGRGTSSKSLLVQMSLLSACLCGQPPALRFVENQLSGGNPEDTPRGCIPLPLLQRWFHRGFSIAPGGCSARGSNSSAGADDPGEVWELHPWGQFGAEKVLMS